jgi:hypothetical protein
MSQRMSVFLVATLSCTRTFTLVYPLKRVNPKTVLKVLAVMWILMTCFFVLPPSLKLVQINYHWEGGYCWASPVPGNSISSTWDTFDNAMDTAGLAFPVVPITLSCIISAYKILSVKKVKNKKTNTKQKMRRCSASIKSTNRRATGTIIIVTSMYIVTNIPLFINYVLYLITITSLEYPGPIYSSHLMYFYSWNVTAILSTGLNASANPILYLTRFKSFRKWIRSGCLRGPALNRQRSSIRYNVHEISMTITPEIAKLLPANNESQQQSKNLEPTENSKANSAESYPIASSHRNDCDG